MSSHRANKRRSSSNQNLKPRDHNDPVDERNAELSRTRSNEISIAESIAVQEVAPFEAKPDTGSDDADARTVKWPHSVRYMVYLCGFITNASFGVTQHANRMPSPSAETPMASYLKLLMSSNLAPFSRSAGNVVSEYHDRCSIRWVESSTALNIALLAGSTTIFGIINLFITGSLVKRIGLKRTLMIQVGFPAVRMVIQNIGVEVWGNKGIIIVQCSQIVTVLGGPSGYLLVLNAFITEVVNHEERTAALGRVAGSTMFGAALGFLLGGIVAEDFGIKAPFRVTLTLFILASVYVAIFLPHVPLSKATTIDETSSSKPKQTAIRKFFGPLFVFTPKKFITRGGVIQTEYGTFLLACGVFLGIMATGYLPTLLQLYSTDAFSFGTKANGYLIFIYSLLRGVFLTFAFPKLIALGRRLTTKREEDTLQARSAEQQDSSERAPLLSERTTPNSPEASNGDKKEQTYAFDLIYTRFSLLTDGLLTLLCSFVQEGWQMYLVAVILPFSAGTGSAAKGTVLQMVGSSASSDERTDALAGISLIENIARLSTTFIFGVIFAAFASIGRTELVFTCNAAIAIIGFLVLFLARFPPEGSRRLDQEETPASED